MSFIAHGLQCTNDECALINNHVFYRKSVGPPACPDCDSPRKIYWGHGRFPGVSGDGIGSFTAMDMGIFGKVETREEYNRVIDVIKQRYPGKKIIVEGDSQADKQARADAARQRAYDNNRKRSLDATIVKEVAAEAKVRKAEGEREAVRHNHSPDSPKYKRVIDSATSLVTGGKMGKKGNFKV